MKKIIILFLIILLCGCASKQIRPPMTEGPTLPDRPDPLLMDNGKHDIKKYPNTKWVKEPKTDTTKGIACWSNKDVETISKAITERDEWADAVEEVIREYNKRLTGGEPKKDFVPWYKKLFQ